MKAWGKIKNFLSGGLVERVDKVLNGLEKIKSVLEDIEALNISSKIESSEYLKIKKPIKIKRWDKGTGVLVVIDGNGDKKTLQAEDGELVGG